VAGRNVGEEKEGKGVREGAMKEGTKD